jgi:hypothetical protein
MSARPLAWFRWTAGLSLTATLTACPLTPERKSDPPPSPQACSCACEKDSHPHADTSCSADPLDEPTPHK